jgi:hypothetical protein
MCASYVLSNIACYRKTSNDPYRPTMVFNALLPYIDNNVVDIIGTIWMTKSLSIAFSHNLEKRFSYSHSVFRTELLELKNNFSNQII